MKIHEQQPRHGGDGQGSSRPGGRDFKPPEITSTVPFLLDAEGEEFERSAFDWAYMWKKKGLTSTQLRNYYNELLALYYAAIEVLKGEKFKENDLDQKDFLEKNKLVAENAWKRIELEFKLFKARAAYALRQEKDKRMDMVAFIHRGVELVNDVTKLRKFKLYFEAALAHFTYLEKAN